MDVRVPASKMNDFETEVWSQSSVMIPNLQELIPEQPPALLHTQNEWDFTDNAFWLDYHDMATLNNFTESMIQAHPKLVSRVSIGQTYEGREIFGMSIHGYRNRKKKETNIGEYYDEREEDEKDDDDGEADELEEVGFEAKIKSWWSWLFGPARAFKKKPSRPSKHPKTIIIHAGQHARGSTCFSFSFHLVQRPMNGPLNIRPSAFRVDRSCRCNLHRQGTYSWIPLE